VPKQITYRKLQAAQSPKNLSLNLINLLLNNNFQRKFNESNNVAFHDNVYLFIFHSNNFTLQLTFPRISKNWPKLKHLESIDFSTGNLKI
jgi:hypothetical protein